ncbi:hypothetical protein ACQKWADRAFT_310701 [Trichoderma austrokoningii]
MTSSKSFRAALLPSSFRSHSQNGSSDSKATSDSDTSLRKTPPEPLAPALKPADGPHKSLEPVVERRDDAGRPPSRKSHKSKPWSTRISSLIPSLTLQTDHRPMSIQRKPVGSPAPPNEPPPPPPPPLFDAPLFEAPRLPEPLNPYMMAAPLGAPPPPPPGPPPPPPQQQQQPSYSVAESTSPSSVAGDSSTAFESAQSDTSSLPYPRHSPPHRPQSKTYPAPDPETPAVSSQISLLVMPQADLVSPVDYTISPPHINDPIPPSPSVYSAPDTPAVDNDVPVPPLIPLGSFNFETQLQANPVIMDPIPPSPEPARTTFTIAEALEENVAANHPDLADHNQASGESAESSIARQRSMSYSERKDSLPPLQVLKTRQTAPLPEPRGRSVSARVNSPMTEGSRMSMSVSTTNLRPISSINQSPTRRKLRRSWMPGRSRSSSMDANGANKMAAWVMSDGSKAEYNTAFLTNGEKVPELWNENGAVLVYLYPKSSGRGPSFKVPEFTVSSSFIFNELIRSDLESAGTRTRASSFTGRNSLSYDDASRGSSPTSFPADPFGDFLHLYIPSAPSNASSSQLAVPAADNSALDLERLIAIRNVFAFLTGQPLVGTAARPTNFHAFLQISDLLQEFCFSSPDGYTFGSAVDLSFGFYSESLGFGDCRASREQTLEALILGERMRCLELYNEAFVHAVGKYSSIMDLRLPLFQEISPTTRQRLEKAHFDLENRYHNVKEQLEQFEFPSLFAGIANSSSIPELKQVRFKIWRNSFNKMRQFVLSYYKSAFGSWPPKASSKKNPFVESGLNRIVLKTLYSDHCALYDLLVDRNSLTTRVIDEVPNVSKEADEMITSSALRVIESEFDRSRPPVLPPVPFDLPLIPSMTAILETYNTLSPREQARFDKKVKEAEMMLVLNGAYNYDTASIQLPFLDYFKEFEAREAKGKTAQDLVDQRIGYFLFLYVILQSLPMLVVDAPDLKYAEGVEYFLCQPPMGNPPWVDDKGVRRMWYEVAGGGYVELSADAVMFSVEAIYHRSHCWLAAKIWEEMGNSATPPLEEPALAPLEPPRPMFQDADGGGGGGFINRSSGLSGHSTPSSIPGSPQLQPRLRNQSPATRANRSSIMMGLEPVPLEPPPNLFGVHQRSSSLGPRPMSSHLGNRSSSVGNLVGMNPRASRPSSPARPAATSGATFDDILGEANKKKAPKKKGRFF